MTMHRSALTAALVPVLLLTLAGCYSAPAAQQPAATQAPATQPAATQPSATQPTAAPTASAPAASAAPNANTQPLAPTLVRTQGAVEIFDGPAPTPLAPVTNKAVGAEAIELAAAPAAGSAVTDTAGFSLYRFDNDTANPSTTTCVGDCAAKWPPLLVGAKAKIYTENVDPNLVGYVERADGTCQVTIGGWPVYYFAQDAKPGDALGQGVGGTWFAIDGQGKKATTVAAPSGGGAY